MGYNVIYKDIGFRDYKETWDLQEEIFTGLIEAKLSAQRGERPPENTPGTMIFVEHPHVYTLGKNGSENNLLINSLQMRAKGASFYRIDRGGDITYHGPGQIVGYPIFDLEQLKIGLKEYIFRLEQAIINTLDEFSIKASRLDKGTGVWLEPEIPGRARKICAIGVRASRFVTMHGFALNVNTDLSYFNFINPCGFVDKGVTSMEKEKGIKADMDFVKEVLKKNLQRVFDIAWSN
ncbi:MAG: lipoyl(octanoyl) transferase LipB [Bacteroidales bacterium]|nr:lipoyl(octanoyl) transferase LipB [Bacteroidales bacterium]